MWITVPRLRARSRSWPASRWMTRDFENEGTGLSLLLMRHLHPGVAEFSPWYTSRRADRDPHGPALRRRARGGRAPRVVALVLVRRRDVALPGPGARRALPRHQRR